MDDVGATGRRSPGRESSVSLPALPQSVRDARAFVRTALTGNDRDDLIEDAQLAVSELVTNAVVHAGTPIRISVSVDDGGVRVAVRDGSPRLPRRREYADTAGTGRGLRLLTELTSDWGADGHKDGKTVWFALGTEADQRHAAQRDEQPDPDPATVGPADGAGRPSGASVVLLLNAPVLLYAAWRQHAETLLREYFLFQLDRGSDEEAVAVHSAASDALALLDESIPPPPATHTPAQALAAATAPEANAPRIVMGVPASVRPHFGTLNRALDEAIRLAEEQRLLAPPVQPELRLVRKWICNQVETQSVGTSPRAWEPFVMTELDAATPPSAAAPALAWDTSSVTTSGRAVVAADDRSTIVAVSRSAVRMLGYESAGELVGRRLISVIPDRFRQAHLAGFTFHLLTGDGALLDVPVTVPVLRRDGTETLVRLTLSQQHADDGRPVFLGSLASSAERSRVATGSIRPTGSSPPASPDHRGRPRSDPAGG